MTLKFNSITLDSVDKLLPIENDCHSHPWSKNTFTSCIGDRYFGFFLSDGNDIVGFYVGEYILGESTLMDICVSPDFQGQGYGKHLLSHYNDQAKQRGAHTFFLEVRAKNTSALMMYINDGYLEVGRRTGYYPSEVGYEDAIVMKKT